MTFETDDLKVKILKHIIDEFVMFKIQLLSDSENFPNHRGSDREEADKKISSLNIALKDEQCISYTASELFNKFLLTEALSQRSDTRHLRAAFLEMCRETMELFIEFFTTGNRFDFSNEHVFHAIEQCIVESRNLIIQQMLARLLSRAIFPYASNIDTWVKTDLSIIETAEAINESPGMPIIFSNPRKRMKLDLFEYYVSFRYYDGEQIAVEVLYLLAAIHFATFKGQPHHANYANTISTFSRHEPDILKYIEDSKPMTSFDSGLSEIAKQELHIFVRAFEKTVYKDDPSAAEFTQGYSDILYDQIMERLRTDGVNLLKAESSLFQTKVPRPTATAG